MADATTNTSPLQYLHRAGVLGWLPKLFSSVIVPQPVVTELQEGRNRGHDVPDVPALGWAKIVPVAFLPHGLVALGLGAGETAVLVLAQRSPGFILLMDDRLARRAARSAGHEVWGVLRLLLEAKSRKLIDLVEPTLDRFQNSGMYLSDPVRQRVLALAGET